MVPPVFSAGALREAGSTLRTGGGPPQLSQLLSSGSLSLALFCIFSMFSFSLRSVTFCSAFLAAAPLATPGSQLRINLCSAGTKADVLVPTVRNSMLHRSTTEGPL